MSLQASSVHTGKLLTIDQETNSTGRCRYQATTSSLLNIESQLTNDTQQINSDQLPKK